MRAVTVVRALGLTRTPASPRVSPGLRLRLRPQPQRARLLTLPLLSRALSSGGQAAIPDCWRCGARAGPGGLPLCSACGALQPPDETRDWFSLLGSERSFRLDQARLQRAYKEQQRLLHPDNFTRGAEVEQGYSHGHSALLSEAYRTLSRPLSRGLYLLELLEGERGGERQPVSAAFLAHVLELNEQLSGARAQAEVAALAERVEAALERLADGVARAFDAGRLGEAGRLLSEMKYLSSIEEKVREKLLPS